MMQRIHGELGHRGRPMVLRPQDFRSFGIRGDGPIPIGELDATPPVSGHSPGEAIVSQGIMPSHQDAVAVSELEEQTPTGSSATLPDVSAQSESIPGSEEHSRLTGPVQFVLGLMDSWRLGTPEAVKLLGFDPTDLDHVTSVLTGIEQFRGRDVRDRIAHLIWIRMTLWSLFRDLDTENSWLREPHSMLGDKSPLSLLLGGSMEDLLLAREYVESAAGR